MTRSRGDRTTEEKPFRRTRLEVDPQASPDRLREAVRRWVKEAVPKSWVEAGETGGPAAVRKVRSRNEYESWYPVFGWSGLVVPTWPVQYGGLDLRPDSARVVDEVLRPFNLGRLNPLGLNLAAPALFAHGTEEQRVRFLPRIVRNEEVWCQLFSEPNAGSDLASLSTRAVRDGDQWVVNGQKVWTTWAHVADFGILLARTDTEVPKRRGITYFLIDLHQPGVKIRPLRHMGGETDFNEVFLDHAQVPDAQRVGEVGDGWTVANATLSGERQMVAGSGSGGVDRIGGGGATHLFDLVRRSTNMGMPARNDRVLRDRIVSLYCEEKVREWTNLRVRAGARTGRSIGAASSIGKVHQGDLNQRIQLAATDVLGMASIAWEGELAGNTMRAEEPNRALVKDRYAESLPYEVSGMLRSRANTIEGGTTEVNKNIIGERVLGLPREPDPWTNCAWREVPRN
ncbi:MAG TPA: acyl-CoA dehydrogenase family protein [Acidimicrobiales bacterium]|nr:acyl-CoA dehydrogenase family protein [Acidimicrobiales bacterium]